MGQMVVNDVEKNQEEEEDTICGEEVGVLTALNRELLEVLTWQQLGKGFKEMKRNPLISRDLQRS